MVPQPMYIYKILRHFRIMRAEIVNIFQSPTLAVGRGGRRALLSSFVIQPGSMAKIKLRKLSDKFYVCARAGERFSLQIRTKDCVFYSLFLFAVLFTKAAALMLMRTGWL
jgi:hypothetical protein